MYKNVGRRVLAIVLIVIVALYIALPRSFAFQGKNYNRPGLNISLAGANITHDLELKLGLDLIGGSHLVFEADTSHIPQGERTRAMESLKKVIERRVNLFGVSEPNIQLASENGNDRIIVELPGVTDTQKAIELVGKTAQLMFAEVGEENTLTPTDLTGADLASADVGSDQVTAKPTVLIEFTPEGSKKFASLTEKNIGKALPIILDSEIVSAPVVQEAIVGGGAQISGDFTLEEAKALAIQLNAGALPLSVDLVTEKTVGASLGRESVEKSVQAGLVGLGIVLVFMILFYGRLGFVADIGLIVFGIITIALYKLIPVVLTLPGIAGFLLSVGMAVDANILVFERFREETKKGASRPYALETSFGRAWDSIRDANIATLVTAFVLANPFEWSFLNSSGPVRGFAITLALGIGVGLFTGIFVSRNLLRVFVRGGKK